MSIVTFDYSLLYVHLQEGASGLKCSACSVGFYSASSEGCLPCFCSNRTNQCSLLSNTTKSEVCDCPSPFTGTSCENCLRGYYYSDTSGQCEQCDCNGRAEECTDFSGECIVSIIDLLHTK